MAENTAGKQRGRPFVKGQSGCPAGKPKGARHRTTLAAEALLDGEAELLTRKAVELALGGDIAALRLCLERVIPPRRHRPISFNLPAITCAADAAVAMGVIATSVAAGEIASAEAAELGKLVEAYTNALQVGEFDARLRV